LFFSPHFAPVDVARHFIVTLVVARLLQALLSPGKALVAAIVIPLGIIAAKPFIMTKVIAPAEVAGALLGVVIWVTVLRNMRWRTSLLALLLAAQIAVEGLYPFTLRPEPVMFSFIPFIGFEGGSMTTNLQAFLEKIFLYGSLVWLTVACGRSLIFALLSSITFLTAIELVQMYLADRVSEITDPLLALILGMALYFLDLRGAKQNAAPASRIAPPMPPGNTRQPPRFPQGELL
jgi:hypothetical protein